MPDKRLSPKDLSLDQREVYEQMLAWTNGGGRATNDESLLTVGGYAGTGKTTLLGVFAANTKLLVAYVAYTGRAASVLRRKLAAAGCPTTDKLRRANEDPDYGGDSYYDDDLKPRGGLPLCTTIHRLLYRPVIDEKTQELRGWTERTSLDREYDLVVVDEASMVSDDILEDIRAHGVPLMAVGDHGQLPPVRAKGDLMREPDLRLEKIHRQAEGNPIIALSKHIRDGKPLKGFPSRGAVQFTPRGSVTGVLRAAYQAAATPLDVGLLCWKNETRVRLNAEVRKALRYFGAPGKGEVLVCLRNKPPVYNGMRAVLLAESAVDETSPWIIHTTHHFPEEGIPEANYQLCAPQFGRHRPFESVDELRARGMDVYNMGSAGDLYDFGYCLTVHKSQGSQFNHAVVYLDRPERPWEEDFRRFFYTAVTRAAERLTILL